MFTTTNDGPNPAYRLLIAFSDLEKQNLFEKHYAAARTNIKPKPYGASLINKS